MPSPPPVYINPAVGAAADRTSTPRSEGRETLQQPPRSSAQVVHRLLPAYAETPLHSLPSVARALGLGHVLVKDESQRFGLPSFKILGASWAVYRAVAERMGLRGGDGNGDDGAVASLLLNGKGQHGRGGDGIKVITCTAGNWGRAVARMAGYLGVAAVVYVPSHMPEQTRELIRSEGAEVKVVEGDYDAAAEVAKGAGEREDGALLVMDIGWEGYESVPQWVVEGYQTMLDESDAQVLRATGGQPATHAIVPVGCGSIAQAVTHHYRSQAADAAAAAAAVLAVEPASAACLRASLESGRMTSVTTEDSIMCGMNCGTLSTTAWPVLRAGIDGSVVVSDTEAHQAVQELKALDVQAGPCGASTLAALKIAYDVEKTRLGLTEQSVVVLYCTEGPREYAPPA
ncbi:hypothetical protein VTI28DRAFT_2457 [Corynascus sepedonium]